jgi:hypothetical protein
MRMKRFIKCLAADLPGPRPAQTLEQGYWGGQQAALFFCRPSPSFILGAMSLITRFTSWLKSHPNAAAPQEHSAPSLSSLLLAALEANGYSGRIVDDEEVVLESGTRIGCRFIESRPLNEGHVGTSTMTGVMHPERMPKGLGEYQHSTGETEDHSILEGLKTWVQTDLAAIELIVTDRVEDGYSLTMEFPKEDASLKFRQAVFGGISHCAMEPGVEAEEHPFCHCCLFTQCLEPLLNAVKGDELLGIRFFAVRNTDGALEADCRVNGEDFPPGVEALKAYAASWPDRGFEFRKQYVVVRTVDRPSRAATGEFE